jgi:hypothetical protein
LKGYAEVAIAVLVLHVPDCLKLPDGASTRRIDVRLFASTWIVALMGGPHKVNLRSDSFSIKVDGGLTCFWTPERIIRTAGEVIVISWKTAVLGPGFVPVGVGVIVDFAPQ